MNRNFLLLLMIGSAMIIAVIGQNEPTNQLNTMPWEVERLKSGDIHVFGVTLGKTRIQEVNQIFSSFPATRLLRTYDNNEQPHYQLLASYDNLIIGGMLAQIDITYQFKQSQLQTFFTSLEISPAQSPAKLTTYSLNNEMEMRALNHLVANITYIPSIDYDQETLRQRFGHPRKETKINEEEQIWLYPELGLKIYIHNTQADRFVYSNKILHIKD